MAIQSGSIEDLLRSDLRKQIYETVQHRTGRFSIRDLADDLNSKGVVVSVNTIQQFLQALVNRKVLCTYSLSREQKQRGRYSLTYELIWNPESAEAYNRVSPFV